MKGKENMRAIKNFASLVLCFFMASCDLSFGYKPPAIPLSLSVDTQGQVTFSVEKEVKLPTPIGTFSVGVIVDPAEYFGVKNTLTVRYNGEDHFYDLHGQDFDLSFEPGYYKQLSLRKEDQNLYLEIVRGDFEVSAPAVLQGRWEGDVDQPSSRDYTTILTLTGCTESGSKCGSVEYPELSCGGEITYLYEENRIYYLRETITYGSGCVEEVNLELQQISGDSWRILYYWSGNGTARGNVTKIE